MAKAVAAQKTAKVEKPKKARAKRMPRINVNAYVRGIASLSNAKRQACGYCGNENAAASNVWVCAYCESANFLSTLSLKQSDEALMGALSNAIGAMIDDDYEAAAAEYDKIAVRSPDPQTLYGQAVFYFAYSNNEVASIRYDRPGFMEENAMHREKASAMHSKALRILSKVSYLCDKSAKEAHMDAALGFTFFMASVKMGDLKTARRAIDIIEVYGNTFLGSYARMVFGAELGQYADVVVHAQELLKADNFSPNAYYYTAWALFKYGRANDARRMFRALEGQIQSNSISAMVERLGPNGG